MSSSPPAEATVNEEYAKQGVLGKIWHPRPKPPGFAGGKVIPEVSASWWSFLTWSWLTPLLSAGFSRPLEVPDLWELDDARRSDHVSPLLEHNFYARCPPEKRPRHLQEHNIFTPGKEKETNLPNLSAPNGDGDDVEAQKPLTKEEEKRRKKMYDESLVWALEKTFRYKFWMGGILQLIGDGLATTSPLVTKALLQFLAEAYLHARYPLIYPKGPPIGKGIGLAIGLFAMQEGSSIAKNHAFGYSMTVGLMIRSTIIGQIFRKALRLSGKSRVEHSPGKITTMLSTDTTRLDFALGFCHSVWVSPLMIILALGLLIDNLGYSALVAVGVLVLGFPIQGILVKGIFMSRKKGIKITDARVRLLQEVIQGIRLVKIYAWETLYGHKVDELRRAELKKVRSTSIFRSSMISITGFIPILASILAFITYSLTGHELDAAIIFSSLQLLNVLRMPLIMLPFVFSLCTDAVVSLGRVSKFLTAEELAPPYPIHVDNKFAVDVDGDFTWEVSDPALAKGDNPRDLIKGVGGKKKEEDKKKAKEAKKEQKAQEKKEKKAKKDNGGTSGEGTSGEPSPGATIIQDPSEDDKVFKLRNIDMKIHKGQFVALVGRIGSGKSSCFNAIIGEMRKTRGEVSFNGSIAYTPQNPWLANATVRDNILFGNPYDEERFQAVVEACSLEPDFEMLPNGEHTEIGEKGINLSGGQKARVSLARVAYSNADIVLLDDPLSAVDAHVGKNILENCLTRGPLADRTRVLATHALSALPKVDYIYVFEKGEIVEHGTYQDLIQSGPLFSRLMADYGGTETVDSEKSGGKDKEKKEKGESAVSSKPLMQEEDRNTGQIQWFLYALYITAAGGWIWATFIMFMMLAEQAAQIVTTIVLGWWTSNEIHGFNNKDYMAVYAGVGGAQAVIAFFGAFAFALAGLKASFVLFQTALKSLLRSPVSFYDTTPVGRVLSRLSRDVESLDNQLPNALYQLLRMLAAVVGAIALIFYTFPYLGIAIPFLFALYYAASAFYRRTSIETKRLDSILRSTLYANLGEALTGLSTIHAWRAQDHYLRLVDNAIDGQNRAYILSVLVQRWLAIRLDLLANLLVLGIGFFAVGLRKSSDPSKTGVVLSYTLAITQTLSQMVTQMARSEQEMNAVERLDHYGKLPGEAPPTTNHDPDAKWPERGEIRFENVDMAYRPGLPLVLKGISFDVKAGEKIGIVGRTGAGKSSMLQALFRIVEIEEGGKIEIDGINTKEIGLDILRQRLAVIPQDALLFKGTVRENIDPLNQRTDAELLSAMRRSGLLSRSEEEEGKAKVAADGDQAEVTIEAKGEKSSASRFDLNASVSEEGSNFSAGERQLIALCRALVKESRVIVMDEATSNVDVETDAQIQRTIQREFAKCTLLCIAHRLNTIVYYDRILVLDQGQVAEFDTPLALYDREDSIFHSLCSEASLNRQDIVRIRSAVHSGHVEEVVHMDHENENTE
ncbi:hypothetical protein CPB86DRAFT_748462 [Serendipita vermifera]|nr:hypothetical protein CPB86DRAFT_748462 [Serendipita vermifera]